MGGTFTDFSVLDETDLTVRHFKLPSTPHDPSAAIFGGLDRLMCARGVLLSDLGRDFVATRVMELSDESWRVIARERSRLRAEAEAWLAREGVTPDARRFHDLVEARYVGQNHEVRVAGEAADAAEPRRSPGAIMAVDPDSPRRRWRGGTGARRE